MRWKLLIVLAFVWLTLGIVGLHVAQLRDDSPLLGVALAPAALEYSVCRCVDRVFVDAAHGPPFLTVSGIVLVYLLPAVLLIWFALYRSRPRGYALVAALPIVLIGAGVFPWMYESAGPARGSDRHGDYAIEQARSCRMNAPANTHRLFYKDRVLTRIAGAFAFSPLNPSRILYEDEPWCTDQPVATFYFDGIRDAPVKVFDGLEPSQLSWSADDRFLVSTHYALHLVNLQTGGSVDLSDFFVGKGVNASHAEFRGWSPDGKRLTLANVASYRRDDGSDFRSTDVVSLDPATLEDRYLGTTDGPIGEMYQRAERQRTTDLGGGVTLVETVRGFQGESTEVVIHQTVLRGGAVVWESRYTTYDLAASPDHRYLVAWNDVNRLAPWRVYDLSTGKAVAVQQEEGPGRVPPKFGRWSDDSQSIVIAVDAYEGETDGSGREKPDAKLVPYRQTFLVDPSSGALRKQTHCQQPGSDKATWDNTPCAGPFR